MPVKSWSILYSKLLCKMYQDFLDLQYTMGTIRLYWGRAGLRQLSSMQWWCPVFLLSAALSWKLAINQVSCEPPTLSQANSPPVTMWIFGDS